MLKIFLSLVLANLLFSCQKEIVPPVEVAKTIQLPQASVVAQLISSKPLVQHRPAQTINWTEAFLNMPLHNKDEIKTSEGAQAQVEFTSGKANLKIDEKSFVVIWDRDEEQKKIHVVALPEGTLKGSISVEDKSELEIRTPAGWIRGKNTELSVTSSGLTKSFKITVTKGEASIETAAKKTILKAGKSLNIVQVLDTDKSDFLEIVPLKSTLLKEKVFSILIPKNKELKTKSDKIKFSGVWEGEFSVWANGAILKSDGEGKFSHEFSLSPGLNVITLQVSDPDKKNVEYFIYKVTREIGL